MCLQGEGCLTTCVAHLGVWDVRTDALGVEDPLNRVGAGAQVATEDLVEVNVTTDGDLGTIYSVAVPVKRVKASARLDIQERLQVSSHRRRQGRHLCRLCRRRAPAPTPPPPPPPPPRLLIGQYSIARALRQCHGRGEATFSGSSALSCRRTCSSATTSNPS